MLRRTDRWLRAAVGLLLLSPLSAPAQGHKAPGPPPDAEALAADERDPALARWEWFVELTAPAGKPGPFVALDLSGDVLGKAHFVRQDDEDQPADLRLVDASGGRLPYVPRVLRTRRVQRPVDVARRFDAGPDSAGKYYQESFELKDAPAPGHNEIEVRTPGTDFRRKVQVYGSNDAAGADAQLLLSENAYLIRYAADDQRVDVYRFRYALKQFRFLKVRVYADPTTGEKPPVIESVTVRQADRIEGRYLRYAAALLGRQSVPADNGPGSAWFIQLGVDPVFCEKLSLAVPRGGTIGVERPFRLEIANPDEGRVALGGVEWRWRSEKGSDFLDLSFREVRARRLRLVVTDHANPPLDFGAAEATLAVRQVVFETPKADAWPLRLYFGHPHVPPANYDLGRKLPAKLDPALAGAGPRQPNPNYVPPPPRVHERYPWLVYLVLGIACLVLAALLVPLARQALARADATPEAPR